MSNFESAFEESIADQLKQQLPPIDFQLPKVLFSNRGSGIGLDFTRAKISVLSKALDYAIQACGLSREWIRANPDRVAMRTIETYGKEVKVVYIENAFKFAVIETVDHTDDLYTLKATVVFDEKVYQDKLKEGKDEQ